MIKKIGITNLFGIKNNNKNIEFNEDLTILVGLNGSGKTTLLNILNAIFSKQFHDLVNYQFKEIEVESDEGNLKILSSNNFIFITRTDIAKEKDPELMCLLEELSKLDGSPQSRKLIDKILSNNTSVGFNTERTRNMNENNNYQQMYFYETPMDIYELPGSDSRKEYFLWIIKNSEKKKELNYSKFDFSIKSIYFPTYRRLETDFMDLLGNNSLYYDSSTLQANYRNIFGNNTRELVFDRDKAKTIIGYSNKDIEQVLKQKWNKVNRIEAQLLNSLYSKFMHSFLEPLSDEYDNMELIYKGEEYEAQLLEIFGKTGLISNSKNKTIKMISSYVENVTWAEEEYARMSNDDNFKSSLNNFELLLKAAKIKESQKQVDKLLKIYQDTIKKIEKFKMPFETLTKSLSFFLKKEVYFHDNNIYFKSGKDKLVFKDLSAGEKQLVSMFIYIWLDSDEGSTIMIDEPELSLHVTWQRDFLSSLTANTRKVQYVISTHSPFIMGKYKDKVVKMGLTEEEFD